ncbi:MAG TPA: S8 family serine peptidase [Phycisphaerales bacterium]|nr:S8 family serine peptidase [Phycisphaerales bacterium]
MRTRTMAVPGAPSPQIAWPALGLALALALAGSPTEGSAGTALSNDRSGHAGPAPQPPTGGIHPALRRVLAAEGEPVKAWIFLADRGFTSPEELGAALAEAEGALDPRTRSRRLLRRTDSGLVDERDLPVNEGYIRQIEATGVRVHARSSWLNAVSAAVTAAQAEAIAALPFVRSLQPVRWGPATEPVSLGNAGGPPGGDGMPVRGPGGFYGQATAQLAQVNLPAVHAQGFTGAGVVVGVLDTGFLREHVAFNHPAHPLVVVAEHDFVMGDGNTAPQPGDDPNQHGHGTLILGVLAAYAPDSLVGGAYDASFILCKTENVLSETPVEEDNYVAALQFIEAHGGDLATASLLYSDWYTPADYNGLIAVTTIAVNTATANGLHCLSAVGNSGHDADPTTHHLGAPADAFRVISCGAVRSDGVIAGFSSDGPTVDGRVKPEVLARGVETATVAASGTTGIWFPSGTSLSTPVAASVVACLVQARPGWTVDQMRTFLTTTASDFAATGTTDPLFIRGYGIVNAAAALDRDCNANGVPDPQDVLAGAPDYNGNSTPDSCEPCIADVNLDGDVTSADISTLLGRWFADLAGGTRTADFNDDNAVTTADITAFLGAWFAGIQNGC